MSAVGAVRPRTYGKKYAWTLVIGFTAASVILNGAHAVLGMAGRSGLEQGLAAVVAVVAPLSLLLATHLVVGLIRDWSRRRRWVTRLRALCAATTVGIGLIAFATSFVALMDMAELMGVTPGLTWALPAVVDAMIVIATLAVVVAEAEIALDQIEASEQPAEQVEQTEQTSAQPAQVETEQPAQIEAEHPAQVDSEHPAQIETEHPTEQPAQVETERPVEHLDTAQLSAQLSAQEVPSSPERSEELDTAQLPTQPVQLSGQDAAQVDSEGSDLVFSGLSRPDRDWLSNLGSAFDEATEQAERPTEHPAQIETEHPAQVDAEQPAEHPAQIETERPTERPVERSDGELGTAQMSAQEAPSVDELGEELGTAQSPAQAELDTAQDVLSLAERAHAQLEPKVSVETLAELISAHRDGASQRRLGEIAGISPTTATRYVKEAEEM